MITQNVVKVYRWFLVERDLLGFPEKLEKWDWLLREWDLKKMKERDSGKNVKMSGILHYFR